MNRNDFEFLKKFSAMIAALIVVTIGLIIGAHFMNADMLKRDPSPQAAQATEARIAPVGAVFAGADGKIEQMAAEEEAKKRATGEAAYGGTSDGKVIFDNLCTGCHTSGAGGAPTLDPSHWTARVAQGMETLDKHAIEGFTGAAGVMPAKGGNPALTDDQVKAAVAWMVKQATGK